ncbi:MAG TPA: DUF4836 family protein [Segetibacter sp.]|jgi:hypothetical protein
MKPLIRLSLLLVVAIALFSSCKNSAPKQTRFIPKDAVVVATINSKSLQDKLVKSQATLENFFKTLTGNSDTALEKGKKEWEDLKNSGIDIDENIYLSVVQKGGGQMSMEPESSVFAAVGGLKDAAKFEAYLKKKDATAQVTKDKDFSYAVNGDNMVAWGKEVVIFMTYNETVVAPRFDSGSNDIQVKPVQAQVKHDVKAEMAAYFNLKEDESMASIAEFRDLSGQKADGSLWVNHAGSSAMIPVPLPKVTELTENSYSAATLNFEDGKIVMDSKTYTSKAMGEILEKHTGSAVNLDMVRNYPSNNVNAFFVASFNPEFINGVVRFLEVGGFVDQFLTRTMGANYTLQDVLKAVKGDVALVVSDMNFKTFPRNVDSTSDSPAQAFNMSGTKILLNMPVGDKAQMNKLFDKLVEQQMVVKVGNEYKLSPVLSKMGYHLSVDEKNVLVASDSMLVSQYRSGTAKSNIDQNLLDGFKGKSSAGFVDLERIMNTMPPDSSSAESLAIAKNTFKNIRGYTENFNGKHIEGHFEVNMTDNKENSLTSLLKFMAAAGSSMQKHRVTAPRSVTLDSTGTE